MTNYHSQANTSTNSTGRLVPVFRRETTEKPKSIFEVNF